MFACILLVACDDSEVDPIYKEHMSIGEAEDYRFYWSSDCDDEKPEWIEAENPRWPGNYKVKYWNPNWQSIIFGSSDAYLDKILAGGFDGVYLDIIDAFDYFE